MLRSQRIRPDWFLWAVAFVLVWCVCIFALGCKSEVKGGQAKTSDIQKESTGGSSKQSGRTVRIDFDGNGLPTSVLTSDNAAAVIAANTTERAKEAATTQASVFTNTGQTPQVGDARAGSLGEAYLEQVKQAFPQRWAAVGLFLALAAGFWFLARSLGGTIVCAALAVLSLLSPIIVVVIAAVLAAGGLAWYILSNYKQLVGGVQNALHDVNADLRSELKSKMAEKHDVRLQKIISAVK